MKKYIIERAVPGAGGLRGDDLRGAAAKSNAALAQLAPRVQWQQSYFTDEGTFCVYLAEDEEAIRRHAEISGFPANRILEVRQVVDPSSASA